MSSTITQNTPPADSGRTDFRRDQTLDAVERYRELGLTPIPLCRPTADGCSAGHPRCRRGPDRANGKSRGKRPLDAGWERPEYLPDWPDTFTFNVGLRMGSGLMGLDVDGAVGAATLDMLERENGPLPKTVTSQTASGQHLLFRVPAGLVVPNSVKSLGAKSRDQKTDLDVRGDGGQIAAWPSRHLSGVEYTWLEGLAPWETTIADAPAWLLRAIEAARRDTETPATTPSPGIRDDRRISRAHAYVARMDRAVSGERGHDTTLNVARVAVRGFDLDDASAMEVMRAYNATLTEQWTEKELLHKVQSARQGNGRSPPFGYLLKDDEPASANAETPKPAVSTPGARPWVSSEAFMEEEHPEIRILHEPFISAGSLSFISAAPGSLKTWFVMDQAIQTARQGHKVLMVVEEGRPKTIQRRLGYLGGGHPNLYAMVRKGLRIDDPVAWASFTSMVLEDGFDLVILDPFADMHLVDENDAPEMRRLINQFKALAAAGPALVVVHHTIKSAWAGAGNGRPAVLLSDARGHGGQMGSVDLSINLVRDDSEPEENVRRAEVYVTKDKDALLPKTVPTRVAFRFTFTFDKSSSTARTELTEVDWKADRESRETKKALDEAERQQRAATWLLGSVRERPGESTTWHTRRRPEEFSEEELRKAFDQMEGSRIQSKDYRNGKVWSVALPSASGPVSSSASQRLFDHEDGQ